jgi:hypothetical protein
VVGREWEKKFPAITRFVLVRVEEERKMLSTINIYDANMHVALFVMRLELMPCFMLVEGKLFGVNFHHHRSACRTSSTHIKSADGATRKFADSCHGPMIMIAQASSRADFSHLGSVFMKVSGMSRI